MKFYKKNSLEKVLLETGCFDIIKLPTKNGGRRPFFRMKPECWIKCDDEGRAYLCKRLPAEEGDAEYTTDLDITFGVSPPKDLLN